MLYIISGVARSGKSILSKKLFREKNISYFPIDAFTSCLEECVPEIAISHRQSHAKEFEKLAPIIISLLTNLSQEEEFYIVEGDGILPHSLKSLQNTIGENNMRICYLGYENENKKDKLKKIRSHATNKDDWTVRHSDKEILSIIENMIERSAFIKKECAENNIAYFDVSDNFEKAQKDALDYLLNT